MIIFYINSKIKGMLKIFNEIVKKMIMGFVVDLLRVKVKT